MKSFARNAVVNIAVVGIMVIFVVGFSAIIHFASQYIDYLFGGLSGLVYLAVVAVLTIFSAGLFVTAIDYIVDRSKLNS